MTIGVEFDASEVRQLANLLQRVPAKAQKKVADAVEQSAKELQQDWRNRARRTAGQHGRRYPNSITSEAKSMPGRVDAEIGPESGMPQGGMGRGFEYGSVNQAPHLDGQKALDKERPEFNKRLTQTIAELLEGNDGGGSPGAR